MRVYLGGPINGCSDAEAKDWRATMTALLEGVGYVAVDPMRRDYRGLEEVPGVADRIVAGDLADIDSCDVLFFNCPKPSYGTAMEVFYGRRSGKTVIVLLPDDGKPASPWLLVHSSAIVRRMREAFDLIVMADGRAA